MTAFPLPLMPLSEGASAMNRTAGAVRVWLKHHPDLGMVMAGRVYIWRGVVAAIATGTSIEDAIKIGVAEREAYLAATKARFASWFTAPADERAAAAV